MKNVDISASSPLNRFTDERHMLSTAGYPSRKIITPDHTPFFSDTLVLEHISDTGVVSSLIENVHYKCIAATEAARVVTGKEVYNKVLFLDAQISGTIVFKEYQVFTIAHTTVQETLVQARDMIAGNTDVNHNYEDDIVNKPAQFNPKAHTPGVDEFVGFGTTKTVLDGISLPPKNTDSLELPVLGAKSIVGNADLKLRNAHTVMADSECGTAVALDANEDVTFTTVGTSGQAIYQSEKSLLRGHISVDKARELVNKINTTGY